MLLTAVLGIGMIRYLNMVAVPLLLFWSALWSLLWSGADGWRHCLSAYEPQQEMSVSTGMNLTMSGFITGAVTAETTPDMRRAGGYSKGVPCRRRSGRRSSAGYRCYPGSHRWNRRPDYRAVQHQSSSIRTADPSLCY